MLWLFVVNGCRRYTMLSITKLKAKQAGIPIALIFDEVQDAKERATVECSWSPIILSK